MTNIGNLAGIRCPECGNEDRFIITATIQAEVTDLGTDVADCSDWHWDDQSMTRCPECDRDGPLAEFQMQPEGVTATTPALPTMQSITATPNLLEFAERELQWLLDVKVQVEAPSSVMLGFDQAIKAARAVIAEARGLAE